MNNRNNTIILVLLLSLCVAIVSGCSSQAVESETSTPNSPTVPPSATSEPPTALPPTITFSPTPEVIELNPSPRGYVNMAYDSESGQIILFGGQTGRIGNVSDETWAYDVTTNEWTNMKPSVSPPRGGAGALVYDVESDRVIVFGITVGVNPSRETWAYDFNSNTWTKMSSGPARHLGSNMAYDVESDRVILFGGYYALRSEFFNDTRVFDYNTNTWMKMETDPSPPGRNYNCMTYNSKVDRVILWGGAPTDTSLWAYDFNSNTWEEKPTNNSRSEVRDYCAMVYSTGTDKIFQYGGDSEGSSQMWMYDYNSNTWTELNPDGNPGELSRFAFVYIPDLEKIVLFGGQLGAEDFNYTQSTWVYDILTNTWTETTRYPE